jgi:hypothetical protein
MADLPASVTLNVSILTFCSECSNSRLVQADIDKIDTLIGKLENARRILGEFSRHLSSYHEHDQISTQQTNLNQARIEMNKIPPLLKDVMTELYTLTFLR